MCDKCVIVCMYVSICLCTVCIYTCMHIHSSCMYVLYMCLCECGCIHTHITYTHAYTHVHTHTHTHTHKHAMNVVTNAANVKASTGYYSDADDTALWEPKPNLVCTNQP